MYVLLVKRKKNCYSNYIVYMREGPSMGESVYVNRKKFVSSLANGLVEPFHKLAQETRIPKSRLLDEAVEDLLVKYAKKGG